MICRILAAALVWMTAPLCLAQESAGALGTQTPAISDKAEATRPVMKTFQHKEELAALLEERCPAGEKAQRESCAMIALVPVDPREGTWDVYFRPVFWSDGKGGFCAGYQGTFDVKTADELWQRISLPNRANKKQRDDYLPAGVLGREENKTACLPRPFCANSELFEHTKEELPQAMASEIWSMRAKCVDPRAER